MTEPTDKTPETSELRPTITPKEIEAAMMLVQCNLKNRLNEKGDGAFASRHEILGTITEEYTELIEAVQEGSLQDVENELIDITVAGLFGIACVYAKKVQW